MIGGGVFDASEHPSGAGRFEECERKLVLTKLNKYGLNYIFVSIFFLYNNYKLVYFSTITFWRKTYV